MFSPTIGAGGTAEVALSIAAEVAAVIVALDQVGAPTLGTNQSVGAAACRVVSPLLADATHGDIVMVALVSLCFHLWSLTQVT